MKMLRKRSFCRFSLNGLGASKPNDIIVTYITKEVFLTTAYRVNFTSVKPG